MRLRLIRCEISAETGGDERLPVSRLPAEDGTELGSHPHLPAHGVKLKGEAKHWEMVGDSGNVKTRAFCPTCGSPVSP